VVDHVSDASIALRNAVRIFAILPLATGFGDIVQGAAFLVAAGAPVPPYALNNAALNSQLMFAGAIWISYAPLLWYVSKDLVSRKSLMHLLFGFVFLSGLARAWAYIQYGSPGVILTAALIAELLIPLVMISWSIFAMGSRREG
jgi:hypothetical protein